MDSNSIILKILHRREKKRLTSEHKPFETSSMGDLAFLLLIFFIVTGSFVIRQGIFFSLPSQTAGSVKLDEKQIIEVYPLNNGYQHNGEVLNRDEFTKVLVDRRNKISSLVLIIFMKPKVKYDRLVDTLSLAQETGIKRVSLKNVVEGDR